LRAYGRELVQKSGDYREVHERHAAYFLQLVETAEPELGGPDQLMWFDRLEQEADNGRAMLAWYLKCGDYERALRVGAAVWRFWLVRGYLRSGRELLARILTETSEPTETRARALLGAGVLATDQGDYDAAREHFEECLAIRREHGDRAGLSHVLNSLGIAARDQGDYAEARRLLGEGLDIGRELGDRSGIANSLMALGIAAHREGDCARAGQLFEEALEIRTALQDQRGIAALDAHLGGVAFDQGETERALVLLERALAKFEELSNKRGIVFARIYLGGVAQERGDFVRARELFVECLMMSRDLGDKQHIVRSLECLAGLSAAKGNFERALELDGAALALRETFGAPRTPIEQRMLERALAPAAAIMRESGIRRTRAAGRSRLLDAVIELALRDNGG
jgi:tetratricopeptide (TPR) repeat protein